MTEELIVGVRLTSESGGCDSEFENVLRLAETFLERAQRSVVVGSWVKDRVSASEK